MTQTEDEMREDFNGYMKRHYTKGWWHGTLVTLISCGIFYAIFHFYRR